MAAPPEAGGFTREVWSRLRRYVRTKVTRDFHRECLFHLKLGHILNLTRLVSCLHARKHQRRCGGHAHLLWFVGRITSVLIIRSFQLFGFRSFFFFLCLPLNTICLINLEVLIFWAIIWFPAKMALPRRDNEYGDGRDGNVSKRPG